MNTDIVSFVSFLFCFLSLLRSAQDSDTLSNLPPFGHDHQRYKNWAEFFRRRLWLRIDEINVLAQNGQKPEKRRFKVNNYAVSSHCCVCSDIAGVRSVGI